jgi:hypothetical protein
VVRSSELADYLSRATFVFTGTVTEAQASSLSQVQAGPNTYVVRIDEVHLAPEVLRRFGASLVTVLSQSSEALSVQQQAIFFTNPSLYGDTLALHEVARLDAPKEPDIVHREIAGEPERRQEVRLRQRIQSAELIVRGQVTGLVPAETQLGRGSEHDPQWWRATIRILEPIKGKPPGEGVEIWYPSSRDVQWYRSPKPQPGQHAIWLLRHQEDIKALTALTELDVRPADDTEIQRIKRLLRESQA